MVRKLVFIIMVVLFSAAGGYLGWYLSDLGLWPLTDTMKFGIIGLGALVGLVLGILLTPWLIRFSLWLTALLEQMLSKTPVQDLVMGSVGLIVGLIIANLLGSVFAFMGIPGKIIWIAVTLLLGYLGLAISVKKREEIMSFFSNISRLGGSKEKEKTVSEAKQTGIQKILDTSVIIDGRIADLSASGFVEGALVVPGFVLEELRHIADSSDLLKRNRGRRGLDILNNLRKDTSVKVVIYDNTKGIDDSLEVDTKLVKLAQKLGAKIVTNDFNLNKVAELHGVKVLNINELANAVKPVVLPGEEMLVQVVKEGKESGQGIAYLDDGTMIVVDGGKRYMHQTITVLVTSVLQTAAGRMIFAKPKTDRRGDVQQETHDFGEVKMLV
ncbi:PIN/TRAM domain-containing protein [Desulfoscipio gibsoniae]|uniref:Integral membrane protein (PIN domain superfamily) n=1 Tax=Desulfoscipio gibsoniae DSM 7213 TaxID=767817 RepID=R4KJW0_9FIRM|nr:PIN/TRAM domain-containing protein [Desulfoscipio gibsoniae]AGK99915.1 integral membrane protein (PIN domain superfamily) [Desulfoscipio gibsoniae DSM 7213]